jgi:enamine deaminase RidA (YjgF/YER057c/UK114 family)
MTADGAVRRIQSESQSETPWEERMGFSSAVAAGDRVLVSGTLPLVDGNLHGESDP